MNPSDVEERRRGSARRASSRFRDDLEAVVKRRATSYAPGEGGTWRAFAHAWQIVGDSGLHTTARDLARWQAIFETQQVGGAALRAGLETRPLRKA